jgi:hypothetical protein
MATYHHQPFGCKGLRVWPPQACRCGSTSVTTHIRPPTRAARERDPAQLEFDFTPTTPLQPTPAAARKEYAEYRRTVHDEPFRRSTMPHRSDPHGNR